MVSANESGTDRPWGKRIGWLLLLWLLGIAALGAVALVLKLVMRLVGLTT